MESNHPSEHLIDLAVLKQLRKDPDRVVMIPKDTFERLIKQLEGEEDYEMCETLYNLRHKVSSLTVLEFLNRLDRAQTSIVLTQLSYLIQTIQKHKNGKNL